MFLSQDVPNRQTFSRDAELFHIISAQADKILCEKDRILFHQGDPPLGLFIVRSGAAVAMVLSERGKAVARFTAESGTVLGLPAIVCDQPYSLSLVARQGSDIGFITKRQFDKLLRDQPKIYLSVLKILAEEVHAARAALANA
jgi:CRP-like cAMP-binding protein